MTAPTFSAADFASALQACMPRGRVWPRDPDATQSKVFAALAQSYARQSARSQQLLVDVLPTSTFELLPEWESTVGLPDPCAGESPTIQQRRAQVVGRLTSTGGQSALYFIAVAQALGYPVTVDNFAPFRAGQSRAGDPAAGEEWFFVWAITAPLESYSLFRAGQSTAGEPLAAWGNNVLECELEAIAPAHTILQFRYSADVESLLSGLDLILLNNEQLDTIMNIDLPNTLG